MQPTLKAVTSSGAQISAIPNGWRLGVPAGDAGAYRLAQLDDYKGRARRDFLWQPPLALHLRARASAADLPGTWGFGLWNDPFSLSLAFGGSRSLPALPNAAWFFFASAPNYLSLRDDLPAQGALAATFRAARLPAALMALAAPALPLLAWRVTARLLRRLGRAFIQQDAASLAGDPTDWHTYSLHWEAHEVRFMVDDQEVLVTEVSPNGPLGLVIWVDNQYAGLPPDGKLAFGTLAYAQAAWIEVADLTLETGGQRYTPVAAT